MCPRSDIDLLLLHDGWNDDDLQGLVQRMCYPLWDSGLQVGYAIHTPRSAVRAADDRLDTATAFMDRRLVWGSPGLLDQVAGSYARWLRRRGGKLLGQLAAADEERHERAGMRPGMLEPDVKAGAGGLRDLHSLRWAAGIVLGDLGLEPLAGARYLGARDYRELMHANTALLTVRCALHLVTAGTAPNDVLRLDLQDEVAARADLRDRDEVLSRVGLAMRAIAHVHGRTWPRLASDARTGRRRRRPAPTRVDDGVHLVDGLVELDETLSLRDDPALAMRAVAVAATHGSHLGRATVTRLQRDLAAAGTLPWDRRVRAAFMTTLRQGPAAQPALADADHIGLLVAHISEWGRVRGHPQRNPYHRYDLDTHLLQTASWIQRIAAGELDERLAAVHERLDEPDVLLLGALFHDIGKAYPGSDHAVVGARVAAQWVTAMGFDQRRAQRVARLVRLHLLLPDVAQHRDIDDRDEIRAVADHATDTETLDALLVLSLADARATGPSAYSPWKDGLLVELHARARRALTGATRPQIADPRGKVHAARGRARELPDGALDMLLEMPPDRYLLVADVDQMLEHARLLARLEGAGAVASVTTDSTGTVNVISLVASDRLGLLADVVGALAGLGLDVLEARAFTRDDGVVLDWFVVRARRTATLPSTAEVVAQVEAAGRGAVDVEALVARQERRWDERPGTEVHLIEPLVAIDHEHGADDSLRIEVEGRDAPGVLYRLLRVLTDAHADVSAARVATLGPQVRDVFFVHGADADHDALVARLQSVVGDHAGSAA